MWVKKQDNKLLAELCQMWTDIQKSFTDRLSGNFATNSYWNTQPHCNFVVTLPCKIWMSENWQQSQICIVINDKSQGSIAKHLSCDGLLHYKFITQFVGERTFNIDEHLAKLLSKWLILLYAPITLHFCPQRCRICHISKITTALQTEAATKCCYVNRQINVSLV